MTTPTHFPMNDLVLRLAGGQRDGELIPVKTQKCFLGSTESSVEQPGDHPQCAIFRGPNGTAVRSYGDNVSVNGIAATVHWLKEGDRIEFPNSMTIEVAQIGWIDASDDNLEELHPESNADTGLENDSHNQSPSAGIDRDGEYDFSANANSESAEECVELAFDQLGDGVEPESQSTDFIEDGESEFASNEVIETPWNNEACDNERITEEFESESEIQESVASCETDSEASIASDEDSQEPAYELDNTQPGEDFEPESAYHALDNVDDLADDPESDTECNSPEEKDDPAPPQPVDEFQPVSNLQDGTVGGHEDSRLDAIESQLKSIQSKSFLTEERFDQFECQMTELAEQIDQLVSLAGEPDSVTEVVNPPTQDQTSTTSSRRFENNSPDERVDQKESSADSVQATDSNETPVKGDLYSYFNDDDDDEKIMTFDAENQEPESSEPSAATVETNDPPPTFLSAEEEHLASRLSEMERVFGSELGNADADADADPSKSTHESTQEPSANEQQFESFTPPTHGPDVESDSFAENSTPVEIEPTGAFVPGSLASQLLSDVLASESESTHNEDSSDSVENQSAEPASPTNSSVAELLSKMKAEGNWDGIPDEDQSVAEPVPSYKPPHPVASEMFEPTGSNGSEPDVNDYMSRLLNRMRGDGELEAEPQPPEDVKAAGKPKIVESSEEPTFVAPENPLRAEEFIPARKAQRIKLAAMRELANSTSRQAVQASEQGKLKELGYTQIGIATCSFLMAVYYLFWNSKSFFDSGFFLALTCIGIAGFLGYRFYSTMKYNEMMQSQVDDKQKNDAPPEDVDHSNSTAMSMEASATTTSG